MTQSEELKAKRWAWLEKQARQTIEEKLALLAPGSNSRIFGVRGILEDAQSEFPDILRLVDPKLLAFGITSGCDATASICAGGLMGIDHDPDLVLPTISKRLRKGKRDQWLLDLLEKHKDYSHQYIGEFQETYAYRKPSPFHLGAKKVKLDSILSGLGYDGIEAAGDALVALDHTPDRRNATLVSA